MRLSNHRNDTLLSNKAPGKYKKTNATKNTRANWNHIIPRHCNITEKSFYSNSRTQNNLNKLLELCHYNHVQSRI